VFTPLVNHTLDRIGNITLEAEVRRYRIMKAKMHQTATQIRALHEQFLTYQYQAHDCANALADADAYMRVKPIISYNLSDDEAIPLQVQRDAIEAFNDPWCQQPTQ
jgi:hypothetical protein